MKTLISTILASQADQLRVAEKKDFRLNGQQPSSAIKASSSEYSLGKFPQLPKFDKIWLMAQSFRIRIRPHSTQNYIFAPAFSEYTKSCLPTKKFVKSSTRDFSACGLVGLLTHCQR